MTEKRAYYTDALAAAWMMTHFGMNIEAVQPDNNLVQVDEWCQINGIFKTARFLEYGARNDLVRGNTWISRTTCHRFYIHPESMAIIDNLPEAKKTALKELGMWPEWEQEQ